MPFVAKKGSQCAFCVFRTQSWQTGQLNALGGNRLFTTKGTPLYRAPLAKGKKKSRRGEEGHLEREGSGIKISYGGGKFAKRNSHGSYDKRTHGKGGSKGHDRKFPVRHKPLNLSFVNADSRFSMMESLFLKYATEFEKKMASWRDNSSELLGLGIQNEKEFLELSTKFKAAVAESCAVAKQFKEGTGISASDPRLLMYNGFRDAVVERDVRGLTAQIKYAFIKFVMADRFSLTDVDNQTRLADLRFPSEWYPATRALQRHIHLHVGPTNSGKTYQALKRLEEAKTGVYAGPLRLLAHEVYTRLNAKNIPCALVTGEERRIPDDMKDHMSACTVEMVPLNKELDVAVIDEIQMIGDSERGWAWTQAVLGIQAKEVHLCGELRTVPLIEKLCASIGDKLTIHRYNRLSPLETMKSSLNGDLTKLRKGDCLIVFSRVGIHAMKKEIEKSTSRRCAVVYGSLPPETRAQQAALFNDPDNDYDFLVASDAVGMGLNLSIKRVIFETTSKFNGYAMNPCSTSDIKQIGGRAGRFKTASQATTAAVDVTDGANTRKDEKTLGLVTTLEDGDLPSVVEAMASDPEPIPTAGIFPPSSILQRFAAYFPRHTPFSYILLRLNEISSVQSRYHLCNLKDQIQIADILQPYNLTVADRITFCAAPANFSDKGSIEICAAYAKCIAENKGGELLEIKELQLEILDKTPKSGLEYLRELEALHKGITLYLWLSYRFAGVFPSQELAFHVKGLVESKIDSALGEFQGMNKGQRRKQRAAQRQQVLEHDANRRKLMQDSSVAAKAVAASAA